MRTLRVRDGNGIIVNDGVADIIRQADRAMASATADVLQSEAADIVATARRDAPVATGRLRDSIGATLRDTSPDVRVVVAAGAAHAPVARFKRADGGELIVEELLSRPIQRRRLALARRLADAVGRVLRGRR